MKTQTKSNNQSITHTLKQHEKLNKSSKNSKTEPHKHQIIKTHVQLKHTSNTHQAQSNKHQTQINYKSNTKSTTTHIKTNKIK